VPSSVPEILRQAARLNAEDPRRRGNTIYLTEETPEVIIAGDIHGNRWSLDEVVRYADLERSETRVLILQEIIHGPTDPESGYDRSIELLLKSVQLKIAHGEKLVFLLGNHDLAQITGNEITKDGRGVCKAFSNGVGLCFDEEAPSVLRALRDFIVSMPLGVRCPNSVLVTHSLPGPGRMSSGGLEILDRAYQQEDFSRGGPAYEWTWGRGHTDRQTDRLARDLGVEFFVLGHQHIPEGWQRLTSRAVGIASDHSRGCLVHLDTRDRVTHETIAQYIRPRSSIPSPLQA